VKKILEGFENALLELDDIVLDSPDAPDVLGKFIARAVVDEVLPPSFLHKLTKGKNERVDECLSLAEALTTEKHRIDRLSHIWGPGDLSSVKRLKTEVNEILEEYLVSGDLKEAENSVRKLNTPSFHFQVVRLAIYTALQKQNKKQQTQLLSLLNHFFKTGLLSLDSIKVGFDACYDRLNDIALDVPNGKQLLDEMARNARSQGWLS